MEKKTYKTPQTVVMALESLGMLMVSDPKYTGRGASGSADAPIRNVFCEDHSPSDERVDDWGE